MTAEGALGPPGVFAGGTTGRAMAVRTPAFKAASCLAYVELAPTAGTSTTSATPSSQTLPTKPIPGLKVTCEATLNILAVGSSRQRIQVWPRGARIGE